VYDDVGWYEYRGGHSEAIAMLLLTIIPLFIGCCCMAIHRRRQQQKERMASQQNTSTAEDKSATQVNIDLDNIQPPAEPQPVASTYYCAPNPPAYPYPYLVIQPPAYTPMQMQPQPEVQP
jgi:hypothetical protein